jgi:hypothetical protein
MSLLLHFVVQWAVESLAVTLCLSVELNVSARRVRIVTTHFFTFHFVQWPVESLAATLRLSFELNVSARRVRQPARKPLRITLRAMVS